MTLYKIFLKEPDGEIFIFELWSGSKKMVRHYLHKNFYGIEILKIMVIDHE